MDSRACDKDIIVSAHEDVIEGLLPGQYIYQHIFSIVTHDVGQFSHSAWQSQIV